MCSALCDEDEVRTVLHILYLILFFFLMIPRPPTSTLFPYTTLFRSASIRGDTVAGLLRPRFHFARARAKWKRGDRKSTRLNSSHPSISYAVFCLKKKSRKPQERGGPSAAGCRTRTRSHPPAFEVDLA